MSRSVGDMSYRTMNNMIAIEHRPASTMKMLFQKNLYVFQTPRLAVFDFHRIELGTAVQ